jgi:sialic acid synthase SpsE
VGAAIIDPDDVQPLVDHGVEFFKTISGDLTFDSLIISACSTGLPVYLSTGASTVDEVGRAIAIGHSAHPQADVRLIHTVLVVPTPVDLLNLRNIQTLSDAFDLPVAYGQHSDNHEALPVAVAAGATALFVYLAETHDPGLPDGPNALECAEVGKLLERIRSIDAMLGSAERKVSDREAKTRSAARRSLVASRAIRTGETIRESDLGSKRPWTGVSPWDRSTLVGRKATRDFEIDEDIVPDKLDGNQEDQ